MNLKKKIAACLTAAVTAICAVGVTAFAADPIGTDPVTITDGKKTSESIPFSGEDNFDNGNNYKDFRYTAPANGVMVITVDAAINECEIAVYRDDTKKKVDLKEKDVSTGKYAHIWTAYGYEWDETAGLIAATLKYEVEKGDYIIRISRCFSHPSPVNYYQTGELGNGRVHIKCEMEKPDAPTNLKVTKTSSSSATITWTDAKIYTSYDVNYKASSDKKWTTKSNVKDNSVTLSGLKANTTYNVSVRTCVNGVTSKWSKTVAFKTTGGGSGKLTAPTANNSVTISWGEVSGADSYEFSYTTDNKNWITKSVSGTSYTLSMTPGVKYTYAVRSKNGSGASSWSKSKSIVIS